MYSTFLLHKCRYLYTRDEPQNRLRVFAFWMYYDASPPVFHKTLICSTLSSSNNSLYVFVFQYVAIGQKRSDVEFFMSDIIFTMSYVVFPTSDVVLAVLVLRKL